MMISKQRGISLPVVMLIVLIGAVAIRTSMALVPMYFDDKMLEQVLKSIDQADEIDKTTTNRDIRNLLMERIRFNDLKVPMDTLEIVRSRDSITLKWPYERRDNVMANIDLVMRFQHEVVFD